MQCLKNRYYLYFFCLRVFPLLTEKYRSWEKKNGTFSLQEIASCPKRAVGDGFWMATRVDKTAKVDDTIVGCKMTLVYYTRKPSASKADKSSWIMHEYRISNAPPSKRGSNGMGYVAFSSFLPFVMLPKLLAGSHHYKSFN